MKIDGQTMNKFMSHSKVLSHVKKISNKINHDYKNKNLVFISVLKSSVFFLSDLVRYINIPFEVDFIKMETTKSLLVLRKTSIRRS